MEQQDILLEAGTNEIEVLEFYLGEQSFGINVLKIKQIIKYDATEVTPLPQTHSSVKGSFLFQGVSTTLVDLNTHINIPTTGNETLRRISLVCEFNRATTAFLTDGVDKIHRLSWAEIQPPPALSGELQNNVTGILILEGRQILMLDFESIVNTVNGGSEAFVIPPPLPSEERKRVARENIKIMAADDSQLVRKHLQERLTQANYTEITTHDNGLSLYNGVLELKRMAEKAQKVITDYLIIVITDIEMPGMDGLTLCKKLKNEIPQVHVLILSSLINEQLATRCREVQADAFLSKKELGHLVATVDQLCL